MTLDWVEATVLSGSTTVSTQCGLRDVGVDLVGALLKFLRSRSMLGGDDQLLLGGDVFTLGACRALFRPGGLPVGFELASPREVAGFTRLKSTAFPLGFVPPLRAEHDPCDQQDDDCDNCDGYEHVC